MKNLSQIAIIVKRYSYTCLMGFSCIIRDNKKFKSLFNYLVFHTHRRAMSLGLPKSKMPEDLFDNFRLVYDRDNSHVVRTVGTGQGVLAPLGQVAAHAPQLLHRASVTCALFFPLRSRSQWHYRNRLSYRSRSRSIYPH